MTDDELKTLKAKAARYDWLESQAKDCLIHPSQRIGPGRGGWRVPDFSHDGQSFGEAIDAHIAAIGEKQG